MGQTTRLLTLDHTGLHRLMRLWGLRPYAIFPGPDGDRVLYMHDPAPPQAMIVHEDCGYHPEGLEALRARLAEQAERLGRRVPELAHRLGCRVAAVLSVRIVSRQDRLGALAFPGVTVVFPDAWGDLPEPGWLDPLEPRPQPALPPYPMHAQVPADPGWWLGRVRALGEGDAASRWRESEALARWALAYLKEAPARLLVEGLSAADPAREVLRVLADFLGDPSGRRYRIWVGCYLSGVVLSAATFGLPSDDAASFLRCLLDRWQAWSTKERRVIVSGLTMLARKSRERVLAADDQFVRMLIDLPAGWLRSLREGKDFRMTLLVGDLIRALRELDHPGAGQLVAYFRL